MAKRYQELDAWRLADELRRRIVRLTTAGSLSEDRRLRDQLRAAANSAPSNIAEGFKRFSPAEFAPFVKYARSSLAEVGVHLVDARDRGHLSEIELAALQKLAARAAIASARLHAYLRKAKPPTPRR